MLRRAAVNEARVMALLLSLSVLAPVAVLLWLGGYLG